MPLARRDQRKAGEMGHGHRGLSPVEEAVADFNTSLGQTTVVILAEWVSRVAFALEVGALKRKLSVQGFNLRLPDFGKPGYLAAQPFYFRKKCLFRRPEHQSVEVQRADVMVRPVSRRL